MILLIVLYDFKFLLIQRVQNVESPEEDPVLGLKHVVK
jgi:hypothetical protein